MFLETYKLEFDHQFSDFVSFYLWSFVVMEYDPLSDSGPRKFLHGTARNGEILRDGSGRLDNIISQEVARPQNSVLGNDETELELSVESRSFVNRVNDQVRKRQKRIYNAAEDGEGTFYYLGIVYCCNIGISSIHGKECPKQYITLKQMCDISAKLVTEQDEIFNVDEIHWEKQTWKHLSLYGDETVISLQRAKVCVFSDSVLCCGRIHQNPESNEAWAQRIKWIASSQSYRDFDGTWRADGIRVEHLPRIRYVAALR